MNTLLVITTSIGVLYFLYIVVYIIAVSKKAVELGKKVTPVSCPDKTTGQTALVIGDSTSYGTGAEHSNNSLVGRLQSTYPHLTITNASHNAMNSKELLEKLRGLCPCTYDFVFVHIGGMDTISFTSASQLHKLWEEIARLLKDVATKQVFLVTVNNPGSTRFFPFPLNLLMSKRGKMVTDFFSELCKKQGFQHIPLYEERQKDPLYNDQKGLLASDGIHPNDKGYGIWFAKMKTVIDPYLTKT